MNYGHPTTLRHPRTMRKSGTEYAASIERHRRTDYSGQAIVFVFCAAVMALTYLFAWSRI